MIYKILSVPTNAHFCYYVFHCQLAATCFGCTALSGSWHHVTNIDSNELVNNGYNIPNVKVKVKQSHYRSGQALRFPRSWVSQISRQSAHEGGRVVSPNHRPPVPPRKYSWYSFLLEAEPTQGHSAAGRILSVKNSNDNIGNRTRDLPACSTVPQTTTPSRAPTYQMYRLKFTAFKIL